MPRFDYSDTIVVGMADTGIDLPIPPANFAFLIESILMQAQIQLGLLNFGEKDEEPEVNLTLARHSIDLLAMLQQKTRGNLDAGEQRVLDNGLTELRFRYVQVVDEVKRRTEVQSAAPDTAATGAEKAEKEDDRPRIITADGGKGTKTE